MAIRRVEVDYPEDITVGDRALDLRFGVNTVVLKTKDGVLGLTPSQALTLAAALIETTQEVHPLSQLSEQD